MIQQFKLLLIVFASCAVMDSYAQKVFVDGAGRVFIDASAIPYTTTPKARTTDATLTSNGTNSLTNISSALSNEKVFRVFEISKKPLRPQSTMIDFNWLEAIESCYNLLDDGGGWRLPTERELSLMLILEYKILEIKGFERISTVYLWSATHSANRYSAYHFSSFGQSLRDYPKTGTAYARCIRDITP